MNIFGIYMFAIFCSILALSISKIIRICREDGDIDILYPILDLSECKRHVGNDLLWYKGELYIKLWSDHGQEVETVRIVHINKYYSHTYDDILTLRRKVKETKYKATCRYPWMQRALS